jgi:hypothetical protein
MRWSGMGLQNKVTFARDLGARLKALKALN